MNNTLLLRLTADLIFICHLAISFIILLGWIFTGLWQECYILLLIYEVYLFATRTPCPLTVAEFRIRRMLNPAICLTDDYIAYYGLRILHPLGAVPSRELRRVLRLVIIAFLIFMIITKLHFLYV